MKVILSNSWEVLISRSLQTAAKWLAQEAPRGRTHTALAKCVYTGNARASKMKSVQIVGEPGKSVHADKKNSSMPGATRLRRRLSKSFQREISGSAVR